MNKYQQLQETNKKAAEEEQNQRNELSKKFHSKIQEISQKLEEQGEERARTIKDNELYAVLLHDIMYSF